MTVAVIIPALNEERAIAQSSPAFRVTSSTRSSSSTTAALTARRKLRARQAHSSSTNPSAATAPR